MRRICPPGVCHAFLRVAGLARDRDRKITIERGAGHDGGRFVLEGTPADLVAARSTLTGEHLAVYVGT